MRMYFAPGERDGFEAACRLLVRRLDGWADERGERIDPSGAALALDYRHRGTPDGRLGLWRPHHVEELLLHWLPRTAAVVPGERTDAMPGTLALLLRHLDAMGLADPRGAPLAVNLAAVEAAAPRFGPAMGDLSRWGLTKFWVTTAAAQGVDVRDREALRAFMDRVAAGEADHDPEALARVTAGVAARPPAVRRAEPVLPVALPPEGELRAAAALAEPVRRLTGLVRWAGPAGRPVLASGALRIADARALVAALGTGDDVTGVRSAAHLPGLAALLAWARRARLVEVADGRIAAAPDAPVLAADPLDLWRRAFDALDTGPLRELYGLPYAVPWPGDAPDAAVVRALRELGAITAPGPSEGGGPPRPRPPAGMPPELAELYGTQVRTAVADASGPAGPVELTPLGHDAVRRTLLARGREAPVVGDLTGANAAGLLGVLTEHYDAESARAELALWTAARPDAATATLELTDALRACPFRTRAEALLDTLREAHPDGPALVTELRGDPLLAPTALSLLVRRKDLDADDIGRAESDLLVAESLLQLLETSGPEGVRRALDGRGGSAREALTAALASGHPDRPALAELAAVREGP
ncbi:hypothetical protein [Streptomyces sp. NPDC060194]|uniref:hypothetical protein n=1 Tax=Streptomyces sp. NPDC060194 TaxID=3347069 RepID=UPI0036550B56